MTTAPEFRGPFVFHALVIGRYGVATMLLFLYDVEQLKV